MKRIGILTGGGDAPGLNAVIRAVVRKGRLRQLVRRRGEQGVIHGNRGRPSPRRLPAGARERVVALLSDPGELARQRKRARLRATETFSTTKVVDRYEALYRRLLGG